MLTILCIATYFKGESFLRECRRQGCRVLLLTSDALVGAAWPRDAIDDVYSIAREATDAEIWRVLDAAGDQRSNSVLEQFVSGDVYHVDSIIWNRKVVFAIPFKYGRPPMEIAHQGGLFITRRLPDDSAEGKALLALNRRLQEGLGLERGV